MIPAPDFPQANANFGPPPGLEESQCFTIKAYLGEVRNPASSVDGAKVVVVAWKPTPEEIVQLQNGGSIYLSMLGNLNPHFLTTSFEQAINPA